MGDVGALTGAPHDLTFAFDFVAHDGLSGFVDRATPLYVVATG